MAKKLSCGFNTWGGTAVVTLDVVSGDPNYLGRISQAMQQAQALAEADALAALSGSLCPDQCGFPIGTYSTVFKQTVWHRKPNPIPKPLPASFSVVVEYDWTVTVNCVDLLSWIQGKKKKLVIKGKP